MTGFSKKDIADPQNAAMSTASKPLEIRFFGPDTEYPATYPVLISLKITGLFMNTVEKCFKNVFWVFFSLARCKNTDEIKMDCQYRFGQHSVYKINYILN